MSEKIKDIWMQEGGPAFPVSAGGETYRGMSLRDLFAGQALSGLIAPAERPHPMTIDDVARACFDYADAMLRAREREGG